MNRPLAVLRPEPGNAATVARVRAAGLVAIPMPLFVVTPLEWAAPDPAHYHALLVTSANAMRLGGPGLERLKTLPVLAVGAATAAAARAAGFTVSDTGTGGVAEIVGRARTLRLLHLAGRDRLQSGVDVLTLYASDPIPVDPARLHDSVALVHSARAAARLAEIVTDRTRVAIAAISLSAAGAAGSGWRAVGVADAPTDTALITAARALTD